MVQSIKEIKTLQHLAELCPKLNNTTLVIFDVGDVILIPRSAILRKHAEGLKKKLNDELLARVGKERYEELISGRILQEGRVLVDQRTPEIIAMLQKQAIKVMALTSLEQGKLGKIPSLEDWRLETLLSYHIDFRLSSPLEKTFQLEELRREGFSIPLFKHGSLFSCGYAKGEILRAFLPHLSFVPSQIIMVDDKREHLESIAMHVTSFNIPYLGLHYTATDDTIPPVDEKLARFQMDYLIEHGEWLCDSKALEVYNQEGIGISKSAKI